MREADDASPSLQVGKEQISVKKRGRGLATAIFSQTVTNVNNPSMAFAQIKEDGSLVVQAGATDIGQGSNTVLTQMAADALGLDFEDVTILSADTEATPYDAVTASSRLTLVAGNAVVAAVEDAKQALLHAAAELLQVPAEDLVCRDHQIASSVDPDKQIRMADAATYAQWIRREPLIGRGAYFPHNVPVDKETGQGEPSEVYNYHAAIANVEVDTETGEVAVLDLYSAVDCGKAINPALVEGQLAGGALMGIGWALTENLYPNYPDLAGDPEGADPDHRPRNFADFGLLTARDAPRLHLGIVEVPYAGSVYGAKAAGEIAMMSVAPAVCNAICDAVGVRIRTLPATPDKILAGLAARREAS